MSKTIGYEEISLNSSPVYALISMHSLSSAYAYAASALGGAGIPQKDVLVEACAPTVRCEGAGTYTFVSMR